MKIEAVQRLKAADTNWGMTEKLLSNMGIDADLVHIVSGSATYELYTSATEVLKILTKKLGQPKTGRKGDTKLYVWDKWNDEIGIVLNDPPDDGGTLEVYDI